MATILREQATVFIFFAGTRVRRNTISTYEDYCPIHRGLHSFELQQVNTKSHVYGVSLGKGKHSGYVGVSTEPCGITRPVDPSQLQSIPAAERWAHRLSDELLLRQNPELVSLDKRVALFHESIQALSVARQVPDSIGNRAAGRVFFPALTSIAFLLILAIAGVPDSVLNLPFAIAAVSTLVGPFVGKALAENRYRHVVTALAPAALRPLALDDGTARAEFKRAGRGNAAIKKAYWASSGESAKLAENPALLGADSQHQ